MNMSSKFNDALEMVDSLSIEEHEELLEIEKKRLIERKRKKLLEDIAEAREDIKNGDFVIGTPEELIKEIEEEVKKLKMNKD